MKVCEKDNSRVETGNSVVELDRPDSEVVDSVVDRCYVVVRVVEQTVEEVAVEVVEEAAGMLKDVALPQGKNRLHIDLAEVHYTIHLEKGELGD